MVFSSVVTCIKVSVSLRRPSTQRTESQRLPQFQSVDIHLTCPLLNKLKLADIIRCHSRPGISILCLIALKYLLSFLCTYLVQVNPPSR